MTWSQVFRPFAIANNDKAELVLRFCLLCLTCFEKGDFSFSYHKWFKIKQQRKESHWNEGSNFCILSIRLPLMERNKMTVRFQQMLVFCSKK